MLSLVKGSRFLADIPETLWSETGVSPRSYLRREFTRKENGSRLQVIDTMAEDAPHDSLPPDFDEAGEQLRYCARCVVFDFA